MRVVTMEAVLFVGLPGSGKSSFFKDRFFSSHVRISLDLLRTRYRERKLLELCLSTGQRFAIDNTNPTREGRQFYITAAKAAQFAVLGYYFQSKVPDCKSRNEQRPVNERVPDVAILTVAKKLELPNLNEGFDQLYYVRLSPGGFVVEEWCDEI